MDHYPCCCGGCEKERHCALRRRRRRSRYRYRYRHRRPWCKIFCSVSVGSVGGGVLSCVRSEHFVGFFGFGKYGFVGYGTDLKILASRSKEMERPKVD